MLYERTLLMLYLQPIDSMSDWQSRSNLNGLKKENYMRFYN